MMKKMMIILTAAVLLAVSVLPAFAEESENPDYLSDDQTIICDATLDDDFAEDRVIIAMKQAASFAFKTYTPSDFPEIKLTAVDEITKDTTQTIKAEYDAYWTEAEKAARGNYSGFDDSYEAFIIEYATEQAMQQIKDAYPNYRQMLVLTLAGKSKENVLSSIKELEKRDDILFAEPDYIFHIDESTAETTNAPAESGNQQSTADSAAIIRDTSGTSPKTGFGDDASAVMLMVVAVAGIVVSVSALRRLRFDKK